MYIVYLKKAKHGYMQVTLIADKFTPNTTADGAAGRTTSAPKTD